MDPPAWSAAPSNPGFLSGPYPNIRVVLEALPDRALVVTEDRRIVFANEAMNRDLDQLEGLDLGHALVGEAMSCANTALGTRCGEGLPCARCGLNKVLLKAFRGIRSTGIVSVARQNGEEVTFLAKATPFEFASSMCALLVLHEMSGTSRHRDLQKAIFSDLQSSVWAMDELQALVREGGDLGKRAFQLLHRRLRHLVLEFEAHRLLLAAEEGTLAHHRSSLLLDDVIARLDEEIRQHPEASDRALTLARPPPAIGFVSDPVILDSLLWALLSLAIEGSRSGESVVFETRISADRLAFAVRYPTLLSGSDQSRVFRRDFALHGRLRGLGPYGMRLVTLRCLRGFITLRSRPPLGTEFTLDLPRIPL